MAKKRDDRGKGRIQPQHPGCNLDEGYTSRVQSFRDITVPNIKSDLINSRYVQSLLLLTVIGAFFRLHNLGYNSLWLDEASTYTFSVNSFSGIWESTKGGEFNPPLFYWVEHTMLFFGNNEIILRIIPALLGILTIPLIYLAGSEYFDRNVGIIAAAACAFSPFLIFYSQEARAYSMMLFFVTFSTVYYFRALKKNDMKDWAVFGLLAALAFWSHFYAMVIIAALVLYALAMQVYTFRQDIRNLKPIATAIGVFTILCLPLIIVTIQLFAKRTASAPTFGIQGFGIVIETFKQISGFSDLAMFILVILFVMGIIQAFLIDKNKGIFLVWVTVLTFGISYMLSYKIPMVPRYLLFLNIFFFIGIAVSYRLFCSLINNRGVIYGFMALLFLISAPMLAGYYSGYSKDDWRGLSQEIQKTTKTGDYVVLVPAYISQPFRYYYSNVTDGTFEFGAYTAEELKAIDGRRGAGTTMYILVTGDIFSADPGGGALAWIQEHTRKLGQNTGIAVFTSG